MPLPELGSTIAHHVRDALYVTVGLGVIGVTNLRERLERPTVDTAALTGAVDALNERLTAVEARIDAVLDQFEDGLPDPAREVVANARGAAKEARAQLRTLTGRAA